MFTRRYCQYARIHGEVDPKEMLKKDEMEFPAAVMMKYILWCSELVSEYKKINNIEVMFDDDYKKFDDWLDFKIGQALIEQQKVRYLVTGKI